MKTISYLRYQVLKKTISKLLSLKNVAEWDTIRKVIREVQTRRRSECKSNFLLVLAPAFLALYKDSSVWVFLLVYVLRENIIRCRSCCQTGLNKSRRFWWTVCILKIVHAHSLFLGRSNFINLQLYESFYQKKSYISTNTSWNKLRFSSQIVVLM